MLLDRKVIESRIKARGRIRIVNDKSSRAGHRGIRGIGVSDSRIPPVGTPLSVIVKRLPDTAMSQIDAECVSSS
jgi:hypothetical protein